MAKKTVLSKKDLFLNHLFSLIVTYNGVSQSRKGGIPLCASFALLVDKLYPKNKERQLEMLERHSGFYMTDYAWGGSLHGILVALEEQRALEIAEKGESEISPDLIDGIKNGLMGPLAGFGDTINQSVVRAAVVAYTQPLAAAGNPLAAFIGWLGNDFYRLVVSMVTFFLGYRGGIEFVEKLTTSEIVEKALTIAGIFAMMMMGGLTAQNINFATTIQLTSMTLDEAIELCLPGIYKIAPPFIVYWLIARRKMNPVWIIAGIMVITLVLAALGIVA